MKLQTIILLLIILFCLVLLLMKINIIETFEETTNGTINNDKTKKKIINNYNKSISSLITDDEIKLTDSYDKAVLDADNHKILYKINLINKKINNRTNKANQILSEYTINNIGVIPTREKQLNDIKSIVNNKINNIENIYS